ncbi:Calcium-dependent protein kinase 29 [Glycine soja]|nr:hypothetical protein JHK86_041001 [Glycine max]KHN39398.1 Calcium-dependent protein kinase 29 [Glycine soja]
MYEMKEELGRGKFGVTNLCVEKATGRAYACKSIAKKKPQKVEDVRREVMILQHLSEQHNIVEFKGAYEDGKNMHLVMELCSGEGTTRSLKPPQSSDRFPRWSNSAQSNPTPKKKQQQTRWRQPVMIRNKEQQQNAAGSGVSKGCPSAAVQYNSVGIAFSLWNLPFAFPPRQYATTPLAKISAHNIEDAPLKLTDFESQQLLQLPVHSLTYETEKGMFDAILEGMLDMDNEPWPSISESAKDLVRKMLTCDPKECITTADALGGEASDKHPDSAVLIRMKWFRAMNQMKKLALKLHLPSDVQLSLL